MMGSLGFCSLGPPSSAGAGGDLAAAHRPPGGCSHWARAEERAERSCAGQLHMGANGCRQAGRRADRRADSVWVCGCVVVWWSGCTVVWVYGGLVVCRVRPCWATRIRWCLVAAQNAGIAGCSVGSRRACFRWLCCSVPCCAVLCCAVPCCAVQADGAAVTDWRNGRRCGLPGCLQGSERYLQSPECLCRSGRRRRRRRRQLVGRPSTFPRRSAGHQTLEALLQQHRPAATSPATSPAAPQRRQHVVRRALLLSPPPLLPATPPSPADAPAVNTSSTPRSRSARRAARNGSTAPCATRRRPTTRCCRALR